MRKTVIVLLALAVVLALVSCDPDKVAERGLVGTWRTDTTGGSETLRFRRDGWMEMRLYKGEALEISLTYRWTVSDGTVVLTGGLIPVSMDYSIDGDELTLDGEVYTRVR